MSGKNLDELNGEEFTQEMNRLLETSENVPEETPQEPIDETPVEPTPTQEEPTDGLQEPTTETPVETETPPAETLAEVEGEPSQEEVDYKAAYEKIFSPFKANKTELKVNTPDEVIKLMQMGANYTQRMQNLSPYLKIVKMLDNEGLLDESKLNQLIDISKKNPQAIAKLVQDSGIDPLSIDTEEATKYVPNNYQVSEEEFKLQTVLDEVLQDPDGIELLKDAGNWDEKTKLGFQKAPEQLYALVEQKKNGTYDLINQELARQKLFNPQLSAMPFLDAYQAVGNYMLQQVRTQTPTPPQPPVPVAVRPAVQAPTPVSNVKAAAQVKGTPPSAPKVTNLDTIQDDLEFTKELNKILYNR